MLLQILMAVLVLLVWLSILSWNCWGLKLVQATKIEAIRVRLGYDSSFMVSSMGRRGGLAVFWKHPFDCHIINYSQNFINLRVCQQGKPDWRLTCFFGYPDSSRRRNSWNLLRTLAMDNSLPWCIIGDFNDLLFNDDKRGGVENPPWKIRRFREAVTDSNLIDIPIEGL